MKGNWMRGAVKRPGALSRKAREARMTPLAFARKHAHDTGPHGSAALRTGEEARFALIAQGKPLPPAAEKKKRRRHVPLPWAAAR